MKINLRQTLIRLSLILPSSLSVIALPILREKYGFTLIGAFSLLVMISALVGALLAGVSAWFVPHKEG